VVEVPSQLYLLSREKAGFLGGGLDLTLKRGWWWSPVSGMVLQ